MTHRARRSSSAEIAFNGMVGGVLGLLAAIITAFVFLDANPRNNASWALVLLILGSALLFITVFLFFARRGRLLMSRFFGLHSLFHVTKYCLLAYSGALFMAGLALHQNGTTLP
jgi:membrane-bound ClpP family serine protease